LTKGAWRSMKMDSNKIHHPSSLNNHICTLVHQASDFLPTTTVILDYFQLKRIAWTAKCIIPSIVSSYAIFSFHRPVFNLNNRKSQNYSICAAIKPPKFNSLRATLLFIAFNWVVYSWTLCSQTPPTIYVLSMILHSTLWRPNFTCSYQSRPSKNSKVSKT